MMSRRSPGPDRKRSSRLPILSIGLVATLFVAGTVVAPLLITAGSTAGVWLHLFYSPLCHQMPERSLEIQGAFQAVCARCAGLYAGGLFGLLVFGSVAQRLPRPPRPRWVWLACAVAPTVADFVAPWLGLPGLSNLPRLLLAAVAGLVAAWYLVYGIADCVASRTESENCQSVGARGSLEVLDG